MAVHVDESVPLRRISVESFFAICEAGIFGEEERVELLRGAIVEMSTPTPEHDYVMEWPTMRLVPWAAEAGFSVRVQSTVVFESLDSVPRPDLVVVDRRPRGSAHPTMAHIAIEVSVSSARIDRGLKAGIYAEAGIPEYWVIDVPRRTVLRHGNPEGDRYLAVDELGPGDELRSLVLPELPPLPVVDVLDGDLGA